MNIDTRNQIVRLVALKAQIDVGEVRLDSTLESLGLDSLHLTEIALWMDQQHGVNIPEGDLSDDQTVDEVLAYLSERMN